MPQRAIKRPASAWQTVLAGVRQAYKNPLLVHLGNFMGPTPTCIVSGGKLDFSVVDRQQYDLLHLSYDEFVAGTDALRMRIGESRLPVIAGNVTIPGSAAKPYRIPR